MKRFVLIASMAICCAGHAPVNSSPVPLGQEPLEHGVDVEIVESGYVDVPWEQLAFEVPDRSKFDVSELPRAVRELDGKRVRLRGYIHPGSVFERDFSKFVLLAEVPTDLICPRGAFHDPSRTPLQHLAFVEMNDDKRARFTTGSIVVEGELRLEAFVADDKVICVLKLIGDSAEPVRKRAGYYCVLADGC
jgi:hypothetical protein